MHAFFFLLFHFDIFIRIFDIEFTFAAFFWSSTTRKFRIIIFVLFGHTSIVEGGFG